jgi:hypothetical protein
MIVPSTDIETGERIFAARYPLIRSARHPLRDFIRRSTAEDEDVRHVGTLTQ